MLHITDENFKLNEKSAVMLGNFDGLHRGHLALFDQIKNFTKKNNGALNVVFSFSPHPKTFFTNEPIKLIYSNAEKYSLLEEMGADVFVEYPFDDKLLNMTPERFAHDVLKGKLNAAAVAVGAGYFFGKDKEGSCDLLKQYGENLGFEFFCVPHVLRESAGLKQEKISSTFIRNEILSANFKLAKELLSRDFFVYGTVQEGRKIGRTLGFPTANLSAPIEKLLPPDGVYMTETEVFGKTYKSATSVGFNPTIPDNKFRVVETFLKDFNENIYGSHIKVNFIRHIRGEKKFNNLDELKEQIRQDVLEC